MGPIDPVRRDLAVVAVAEASARLESLTRLLKPRARREPAARRMIAVLDVVAPLLVAIHQLIPPPDGGR